LTPEQATVSISKRIVNDGSASNGAVTVASRIEDATGHVVASEDKPATIAAGATSVLEGSLQLPKPRRWNGVADPYMYRVVVSVRTAKGELLDEVRQPLGLRSMTFDADK